MARFEHLPIYKRSFDLLIWTEGVVRGFSRYHKYTLGTDLRNQVRTVLKTISGTIRASFSRTCTSTRWISSRNMT